MEQTLVLLKPDAVQRGLIGEILRRFEQKGLKIAAMKMMRLEDAILKEHYAHHADKPFFEGLKKFMKSSPVVALVLEGIRVVDVVRKLCGVTKSYEAEPGTIRGDFAMSVSNNVIHASDSVETAKHEVKRFFAADEMHTYDKAEHQHIYAEDEQ